MLTTVKPSGASCVLKGTADRVRGPTDSEAAVVFWVGGDPSGMGVRHTEGTLKKVRQTLRVSEEGKGENY